MNPESDWVVQDVPELRILDEDLWQAVKERQKVVKQNRSDDGGPRTISGAAAAQIPLLGPDQLRLLWRRILKISADLVGCSTAAVIRAPAKKQKEHPARSA